MLQVVMCVWVQCDQCGDILDALEGEPGHVNERAAYVAARARGWRGDPDGRWWCSACALVLTCQRRGHEFTQWRRAHRGGGGWSRRCQRCCVLERRSPDQSPLTPHHPDHVGVGVGVLVVGEVA